MIAKALAAARLERLVGRSVWPGDLEDFVGAALDAEVTVETEDGDDGREVVYATTATEPMQRFGFADVKLVCKPKAGGRLFVEAAEIIGWEF